MTALNRLAARYGIEESFRDARGTVQRTSPATRQALLAAMGVSADSEETASGCLEALDRQEWSRTLPAVQVVVAADVSVPINCPAGTTSVTWRLTLEGGEERTGETRFKALQVRERRKVGRHMLEQRLLVLDTDLPCGYHELTLTRDENACSLIITPGTCWIPPIIEQGRRVWGVSAQLYLLKSQNNWGIGDFSDLRVLAGILNRSGAQAIGVNPLHALFTDEPERASPYSPASRLLLNVLNLDVAAVAAGCSEARQAIRDDTFQQALSAARNSALVDYAAVARLKIPILEIAFKAASGDRNSVQWRQFETFRRTAPASFERSCLFLALREHFGAQTPACKNWREWPADYQDAHSAAVARFGQDHSDRLDFQAWLQFLADSQLGDAARAAAPMAIGLYRDLAVGTDPSGAETWANQRAVASQAQVGAPPDIYNPAGQSWGLPPFHPIALKTEGYRSFIELVRANMRHAGGLRIDHVMGLQQLYWVPQGCTAAQGAYVRYPREDLIGILALESHRNECLVVGEDLGTVPAGFRERLAAARIFSYRVLFFEKDDDGYILPERYPRFSLAVTGSHDLPTLRAWLTQEDLALKSALKLFPTDELKKDAQFDREYDRREILATFAALGLPADPALSMDDFADAAHRFLASTASAISMIQLDDATQEISPVNVPTTSTEHPNWRRRYSKSIEQIATDRGFDALADSMNTTRARVPAQAEDSHDERK